MQEGFSETLHTQFQNLPWEWYRAYGAQTFVCQRLETSVSEYSLLLLHLMQWNVVIVNIPAAFNIQKVDK
jgi:hypothetical protein